jgi:hypothetical protein
VSFEHHRLTVERVYAFTRLELGPIEHERELGFGLDHRFDALGLQKQICQREDILESRSLSGRL